MNRQSSDLAICPRCQTTATIEHKGGRWCSKCGAFAIPPDPSQTVPIQNSKSEQRSPFQTLQASEAERATMPRCAQRFQPVDICTGIYDDGEWLCRGCV